MKIFKKNLKQIIDKYFNKATTAFNGYKNSRVSSEQLMDIVIAFEEEFGLDGIKDKIKEFINFAKQELNGVHFDDALEISKDLIYLTNKSQMEEWLNKEKTIKILLMTNGKPPHQTFLEIFDTINVLKKLDFEIGIAFPSVSDGFSLTVRTEKSKTVYFDDDILFVIGIIKAAVGISTKNETLFYSLTASMFNINLPFDYSQLHQINSFIEILKNRFSGIGISICDSSIDSLSRITAKDSKWKIFIPLDGVNNVCASVENLWKLIGANVTENIDWIVGEYGIKGCGSTPLLFIYKNGILKAVCLDKFDITLLYDIFKNSKSDNEIDFGPLSTQFLHHTFYPDREKFAHKANKMLSNTEGIVEIQSKSSPNNKYRNESLLNLLEVVQSILSFKMTNIVQTIARFAVNMSPKLAEIFEQFGWKITRQEITTNGIQNENLSLLTQALKEFSDSLEEKNIHLKCLIYVLKQIGEKLEDGSQIYSTEIILAYINEVNFTNISDDINKESLKEWAKSGQIYKLLSIISKCCCDKKTFEIHKSLDKIHDLSQKQLYSFLNSFPWLKFNHNDWSNLWHNYRFVYLLNKIFENKIISDRLESIKNFDYDFVDSRDIKIFEDISLKEKYDGENSNSYYICREKISKNVLNRIEKLKTKNSMSWMSSSEKIRSKYFHELVLDLQKRDQKRALNFFQNSSQSIFDWFKKQIESSIQGENTKELHFLSLQECILLMLNICDLYQEKENLSTFIEEYFESDSLNLDELISDEKDALFRILSYVLRDIVEKREESERILREMLNDRVKNKFGCCESCPFRGAICFGEYNHIKKGKKYISCHQIGFKS